MKTLFTLLFFSLAANVFGQVSFTIIEPASIAGGYNFTSNGDGTDWGLPDLLNPADAILDTCVIAEDGTPGLNAQGIPFSYEACGPITNNIAGKIAVVYRYDGSSSNVCWYAEKILNCQNAGAIGVIMINREDVLIDVPGVNGGPQCNIPFAFISSSDGAVLRERLEAGDDVIAFLGNKSGLYTDDAGLTSESTVAPIIASTSSLIAQDDTEFGFDVGASVFNFGSADQNNVSLTATVTGPAGTWTETAGPYSIMAGDTLDIYTGGTNNIPAFSFTNYPNGRYTLTYEVDLGIPDSSDFDNTLSYDFVISDDVITYSSVDTLTGIPIPSANYRAANSGSFQSCQHFRDPNASRLGARGMYFSAVTGYDSGVTLDGEEIPITLYQWDDQFTDLNDPNLDFANLNAVAFGFYYYPSDLQGETVYAEFDTPVQLVDNQRYLACVQINNADVFLGHDTRIDYTSTIGLNLQPQTPNQSDNGFFALGFGEDLSPAIGLRVMDAALLDVDEVTLKNGTVYPNPASEVLVVKPGTNAPAHVQVSDMSGRIVMTKSIPSEGSSLDISSLTTGAYTVTILTENQQNETFKVLIR
ncbi:MAG: T9SS type A sorting domain-containing protein [bacterium]|nr:T9SS type A sorting domain-containing protein [bacterium]